MGGDAKVPLKTVYVEMTAEFLKDLLLGHLKPYRTNLPEDIQIFDVTYDAFRATYEFAVASDKFDTVPEAAHIPKFDVIMTKI